MTRHPLTGYPAYRPDEEIARLREDLSESIRDAKVLGDIITQLGKERDAYREANRVAHETLEAILHIAESYGDGAPDATAEELDWLRVQGLAAGEVRP